MKKQINKNRVGKLLAFLAIIAMVNLSLQGMAYADQLTEAQTSESQVPEVEAPESQVSEVEAPEAQVSEAPKSDTQTSESQTLEAQVSEEQALEAQAPEAQAFVAQNLNAVSSSITIDGYYDDWEEMPMGMLTWNNNNGNAHHDVSFIKDNDYIYIYLGMHPSYQSPIPIYSINLSVNSQTCQLFLGYANAQNTTDWGHQVNLSNRGTYLNLHPFTSYPNNSLGDAAVTVTKGNPNDRMEIRINIKDLEKVMGIKEGTINSGSQLELNMPNVGGGSIQLLGSSTGTILGIALCIGMVIAVKLYRSRKVRLAQ